MQKRYFLEEHRGVAEIIGFLIGTMALFGLTTYVLVVKGQQAGQRAQGLIDIMREAEQRQGELLAYVYAENDDGQIKIYLFNYGTENVTLDENHVFIENNRIDASELSYEDAENKAVVYDSIPPNKLVGITLGNVDKKTFYLTVLTTHKSLYSWQVVL